jgi:hypothetical protein
MTARVRLGAVTALLAAGLAAGHVTAGPPPDRASPQAVPVIGAAAACPDVRQEAERGASTVTAAGAADRTAGPLGAPLRPLGSAPVVRDLAPKVAGAFVVTARGPGAGALVVEQATRATGGTRRGVASLRCPEPGTSSWFVGGATTVGSSTELVLVNLEQAPATLDVRVWAAQGPADPRPGRGLTVAPRSRLVGPLDRLAPDRDLLALHVATSRGRVAASLRVVRADGRIPLGTDWVPPGQEPAPEAVVPGCRPAPDGAPRCSPTRARTTRRWRWS